MYEMSPEEIIKELQYLQCKKNSEMGLVPIDGKGRVALNYAIKAVMNQKNDAIFCPHCGSRIREDANKKEEDDE